APSRRSARSRRRCCATSDDLRHSVAILVGLATIERRVLRRLSGSCDTAGLVASRRFDHIQPLADAGRHPRGVGTTGEVSTMSSFDRKAAAVDYGRPLTRAEAAVVDAALRAYMLRIYNHMVPGLAITGLAALGAHILSETRDPARVVRGRAAPRHGGSL